MKRGFLLFGFFFSVTHADLYFCQIRSCTFVRAYVRSSRIASLTACTFFFTGVFLGQVKSTAVSPDSFLTAIN